MIKPKSIKVGVLADTHGFFNSEIFIIFSDVDHILHAGDIGTEKLLEKLRMIAPLTAVQGNGDYFQGWEKYRQVEFIQFNGKTLLLTHEAGAPSQISKPLSELITAKQPHAVIYGHTHFPSIDEEDGILYFNPGRAGRDSYSGQPSVGILTVGDTLAVEIIQLDDGKFL